MLPVPKVSHIYGLRMNFGSYWINNSLPRSSPRSLPLKPGYLDPTYWVIRAEGGFLPTSQDILQVHRLAGM